MRKYISVCCGLALLLTATACEKKAPEAQTEPAAPAAVEQSAPAAPAMENTVKTGKVLETMDAAGYSYFKVDTGAGEEWVAVTQAPIKVGDEVSYYAGLVMENFESKTLGRTFDSIVFSNGLVGDETAALPQQVTVDSGSGGETSFEATMQAEGGQSAVDPGMESPGSLKAVTEPAAVSVAKASGDNAYTISEIYAKGAELNGQTVRVRAKVQKVSPKIMGKNWLHLQDGSGDAASNTHDLVATTMAEGIGKGNEVTIEGVLAANKDFGAGYVYSVIVEDATVTAE